MLSPQGLVRNCSSPTSSGSSLTSGLVATLIHPSLWRAVGRIYPEYHQLVGGCLAKAPILNYINFNIRKAKSPILVTTLLRQGYLQMPIVTLQERTLLFPPKYRNSVVFDFLSISIVFIIYFYYAHTRIYIKGIRGELFALPFDRIHNALNEDTKEYDKEKVFHQNTLPKSMFLLSFLLEEPLT